MAKQEETHRIEVNKLKEAIEKERGTASDGKKQQESAITTLQLEKEKEIQQRDARIVELSSALEDASVTIQSLQERESSAAASSQVLQEKNKRLEEENFQLKQKIVQAAQTSSQHSASAEESRKTLDALQLEIDKERRSVQSYFASNITSRPRNTFWLLQWGDKFFFF